MKLFPITVFLASFALAPLATALAQPDLNQAPKATNPTNRARNPQRDLTREQRMEIFDDPAKLREFNRRNLRAQLERINVRDAPSQDAVLLFVEAEMNARENLTEAARELQRSMRGDVLTETQFAAQLNAYQVALEDERERRETARATLKKQVDVSKNPRLEAMLTLMGALGDGPNLGGLAWITRARGGREDRPRIRLERPTERNNNPFGVAPRAGAANR